MRNTLKRATVNPIRDMVVASELSDAGGRLEIAVRPNTVQIRIIDAENPDNMPLHSFYFKTTDLAPLLEAIRDKLKRAR